VENLPSNHIKEKETKLLLTISAGESAGKETMPASDRHNATAKKQMIQGGACPLKKRIDIKNRPSSEKKSVQALLMVEKSARNGKGGQQ